MQFVVTLIFSPCLFVHKSVHPPQLVIHVHHHHELPWSHVIEFQVVLLVTKTMNACCVISSPFEKLHESVRLEIGDPNL